MRIYKKCLNKQGILHKSLYPLGIVQLGGFSGYKYYLIPLNEFYCKALKALDKRYKEMKYRCLSCILRLL